MGKEPESKPDILSVIRVVVAIAGLAFVALASFGIDLQPNVLTILAVVAGVAVVAVFVLFVASVPFRNKANRVLKSKRLWLALVGTSTVAIIGRLTVELVEASNELRGCQASAIATISSLEATLSLSTTRAVQLEAGIARLQGTLLPNATDPLPTEMTEQPANSIDEFIALEDTFSVETLDRNNWVSYCDYGTYSLGGGDLRLELSAPSTHEACTFGAKLDEAYGRLTRIQFRITPNERSHPFGWVGLFARCGPRYLYLVANSWTLGFTSLGFPYTEVEAVNSLPFEREIVVEISDGTVRATATDPHSGAQRQAEVSCFTDITDIRFGFVTDFDNGGRVDAALDDIAIWARR